MKLELKNIKQQDWQIVGRIYQLGIDTGIATFETKIPSWEIWDQSHIRSCRIGAWLDGEMVGWTALSPVSDRCVYGGVAEISVYVDPNHGKKGIGTTLLKQVIMESEKEGIWTLQAGVFRENEGSIQLHKKVGFREIGYREKIGQLDGVWFDNVILERRSEVIGTN